MVQCISMGTRKRITTPIHYMYISDTIGDRVFQCVPGTVQTRSFTSCIILKQSGYNVFQCVPRPAQTCSFTACLFFTQSGYTQAQH